MPSEVAIVVAAGIAGGNWGDDGLTDDGKKACGVIREAVEAAKTR